VVDIPAPNQTELAAALPKVKPAAGSSSRPHDSGQRTEGAGDGEHEPRTPASSVPFRSILFDQFDDSIEAHEPADADVLTDLRLDQVIESVTAGRDDYDLKPFFRAPLRSVVATAYRQEVFRDLEDPAPAEHVRSFAQKLRTMREHLVRAGKVYYPYEKERWFLEAASGYCEAVGALARELTGEELASRGLQGFRAYLTTYVESGAFTTLAADTTRLKADLAEVRYRLQIVGSKIRVSAFDPAEPDYGADVLRTFEKFKQGAAKEYRFELTAWPDMNHVEAEILDRVALVHPEVFAALDEYCARHRDYLDDTVARFDREVQFYLAYLEHIARLKPAGFDFCYPDVTDRSKEISGQAVFDLALAEVLVREKTPMVTNDFHLEDPERILVVSGPNQGGKTTFARMIGQLHHLAAIGCPVPGTAARLFLVDRIFSHFEREEDLQNLSGKLEDDLRRIHRILERATSDSLLVMNESFGSTTLNDAVFLNKEVMRAIIERDLLCVSVTFLDELATLGETTVSMVSTVDPDDPAIRTFKIVRRPADGLAYAAAIAAKHGLTYDRVKARIAR
jgi:DNA mismatch repair protein MutS